MKKLLFSIIILLSFYTIAESASFSPDGMYIVSGYVDENMKAIIKLYDAKTGIEIRSFSAGGAWGILHILFSPDSKKIVTVTNWSESTSVILWDTNTGNVIREMGSLGQHCGGWSIEFNFDGSQILSGSWDSAVKIHDVLTGREIRSFPGHTGFAPSASFSPDERQILSFDSETMRLWDAVTGRVVRTFSSSGRFATFSPDGKQILSADGKTIRLWDTDTGREIRSFSFSGESATFSPDGKQILSTDGKTIKLWDAVTGREIRSFSFSGKTATFSPDGKQILSADGKTIKLWDAVTGREISSFSFSGKSATFSPDGKQILFVYEKTIKLWDAVTDYTTTSPVKDSSVWTKQQQSTAQTTQPNNKLVIWSFTNELSDMTNDPTYGFKVTHPEVQVEYFKFPYDEFQDNLDMVLASGRGTPDIITLESSYVRKYVEYGLLLDITDIYENNKSKLIAYPVEVGSYKGRVYALSWQACPGAMFYRRSLAKKYLGTDDPKTVQTYFADFDKLLETARLLKQKSNGSCVVVSSLGDMTIPFLSARKAPWIVNGKLVIDPVMEKYMDICKTLYDNKWEGRVDQWSEGWKAGMKDELKDESGKQVEVFSYFLPTWGLRYVLKQDAPGTSGDWAMCQGPSSYRKSGTWVGAYKGTKNPEAAKEFIRYVATDDTFLEAWAKDTGDMVSNINVINKIKDTYSEPYLGGQNHYAAFSEIAKNVNGKLFQATDEAIEAMFDLAVASFVRGEKSKAKALADFKKQVEAQF